MIYNIAKIGFAESSYLCKRKTEVKQTKQMKMNNYKKGPEFDDFEEDYGCDGYDSYDDTDWERDTWDALTDGQYGDMPEGFDGDYSFLGF